MHAQPASASVTVKEYTVPFKPKNGGRDLRSLSVHPNGQGWIFVECRQADGGCMVMRYNIASKQLVRFALPSGYSYSYAHYSPKGTYILMNRMPIYGNSEEDALRAMKASQLLMMRSDGTDLQILPVAAGVNLSPFMSPDESRVAFWRGDRELSPGGPISFGELNIWEFDLSSKSEKLFTGKKFDFVTGGDLQYLGDDELLVQSYGPGSRFRVANYGIRYAYNEVFRLKRGQIDDPAPVMFPNTSYANHPSVDVAGSTYMWGATEKDRSQGVIRFTEDGDQTIWRTRSVFVPKYMVVDPGGQYVAVIYRDLPQQRGAQEGGFAILDLKSNLWTEVDVPSLEDAKLVPVSPE